MFINLFSRDTQYDVGYEPSDPGVPLWQSPDIVPRNTKVTDPFAGGLFDDVPAVDEIREGEDNYVYTRIRSRQAMGSATNVKAKLWWSEPGTLAVPSSWYAIGATVNVLGPTNSATIRANEFPRIAEFTWPSSSVPVLGHYCLVSSIWSDDDPEVWVTDVPVLGFSEWIRYQNNVAWRNVNVVAAAPTPPPLPRPVTGAISRTTTTSSVSGRIRRAVRRTPSCASDSRRSFRKGRWWRWRARKTSSNASIRSDSIVSWSRRFTRRSRARSRGPGTPCVARLGRSRASREHRRNLLTAFRWSSTAQSL